MNTMPEIIQQPGWVSSRQRVCRYAPISTWQPVQFSGSTSH